jgi:uncharacterized protein YjiS (DUF1127 family)
MEQKMSTISSGAVQPSVPSFSGMIRWAGKGALALATWLERREAIKTLHGLDDRALRDIGLHRSQVEAAVTGNPDFMRLR